MERLEALLRLLALDRLPRTGWIQRGIAAPESIAGHSLGATHLALALAPEVVPPLDVDRVAALCALHDAPEALTGDLPREASRHLPEGAKEVLELGAARELLYPMSRLALERYEEYAAGETREARFARLCDKLQLGVRLLGYLREGARGLDEFRDGVANLDCGGFEAAEAFRRVLLEGLAPFGVHGTDGTPDA